MLARLNLRYLIWFLGVVAVVAAVAATWQRLRVAEPSATPRFRNWDDSVKYVGDSACAECHASIHSQFKRSEMGNSWHVPTAEELAKIGWENSTTHEPERNFHYRAFVDQGRVFQEEFRLNEAGEKVHSLIREARYAIGSGAHGESFVAETHGYLTAMPIGKYMDAGIWDMSPGYKQINMRFDRPIAEECVACHAGPSEYVPGSGNRYQLSVERGIRCEHCHGPGELHVRERRRTPLAAAEMDDTIVNPGRLEFARQNDVCLVCHLIPDAQFARKGKNVKDFRPGMRLADFREDYLVQSDTTDKFGFASHGPRTAQSRCWTEGDRAGEMTCIACHEPHSPMSEVPAEHYVKRCLTCHESRDCTRPDAEDTAENCVMCHMPRATVTNIPHVVFTDHWIRARAQPAADRAPADAAPLSQKRSSRVKLVSFWPRHEPQAVQTRSESIAQIRYFDQHPQDRSFEDLRQAADALQRLRNPDPNDAARWFVLGVALYHMENMTAAAQNYRRAAECPGSDESAYAHAGDCYESLGKFDQAAEMYEASVRLWPEYLAPYERLAALCIREERFARAIELLQTELELNPNRTGAWSQLALAYYFERQDLDRAAGAVRKALELNPDLLRAHTSLGFMYAREGRRDEAIQAYEHALRIDPQHMESLVAAAALYEEAHDVVRATKLIRQALALMPGQPQLERRLRRLQAQSP